MIPLPSRDSLRKRLPAAAGDVVGFMLDNPAQCALIASGAYVVTAGLGRLVRPYSLPGIMATSLVSYAACRWLIGEAIARGVIELRTRHPLTGQLVTLAELERELAELGCADCAGPCKGCPGEATQG